MSKQHPCTGCRHLWTAHNLRYCLYILHTEHRRPCPPGALCTVKDTVNRYDNEDKKQFVLRGSTPKKRAPRRLPKMNIKRLEEAKKAAKISWGALAERAEVSSNIFHYWRKGRGVYRSNAERVAAVLGVPVSELLEGSDR